MTSWDRANWVAKGRPPSLALFCTVLLLLSLPFIFSSSSFFRLVSCRFAAAFLHTLMHAGRCVGRCGRNNFRPPSCLFFLGLLRSLHACPSPCLLSSSARRRIHGNGDLQQPLPTPPLSDSKEKTRHAERTKEERRKKDFCFLILTFQLSFSCIGLAFDPFSFQSGLPPGDHQQTRGDTGETARKSKHGFQLSKRIWRGRRGAVFSGSNHEGFGRQGYALTDGTLSYGRTRGRYEPMSRTHGAQNGDKWILTHMRQQDYPV